MPTKLAGQTIVATEFNLKPDHHRVADLSALGALNPSPALENLLSYAYVTGFGLYRYDSGSIATIASPNVLAAAPGGRWIRDVAGSAATSPILASDGSATALVDVTGTTAETVIYTLTIPAGTLATAGNAVEVQLDGDYLHNDDLGGDAMKVKLNGVTILDLAATEFANSANRRKWVASIVVQSLGASSQYARVLAGMSEGTTTDGKFVNGSPAAARSGTLGTQDANAAITLTVTWTLATTANTRSFRRFASLARMLHVAAGGGGGGTGTFEKPLPYKATLVGAASGETVSITGNDPAGIAYANHVPDFVEYGTATDRETLDNNAWSYNAGTDVLTFSGQTLAGAVIVIHLKGRVL